MLEPVHILVKCHALGLLLGAAAISCGGVQVPTRCDRTDAVTIHIHPASHLNPDRAGLPRSVVLRLYQLDDAQNFLAGSFERIWSAADARPQQLIALPGHNESHTLPRNPRAQYLAVAADFRERGPESNWRAYMRLPAAGNACLVMPAHRPAAIELVLADFALELH